MTYILVIAEDVECEAIPVPGGGAVSFGDVVVARAFEQADDHVSDDRHGAGAGAGVKA
jgi:hypothetical protein